MHRSPLPPVNHRRPTSSGIQVSRITMSPLSQCLPTTRATTGSASLTRETSRALVLGLVERGADVVAHAAVDADVAAGMARPPTVTSLTVPTSYSVTVPGPAIARPGSTASVGSGRPASADSLRTMSVELGGEFVDRRRVVARDVRDAEATAEIDDRHLRGLVDVRTRRRRRAAVRSRGARPVRIRRRRRSANRCGCAARPAGGCRWRRRGGPRPSPRRRRARNRTSGPRARWR